jgi:hypothetical protein
MELPQPDADQMSSVPQLEKNVNFLSEELHLLRQHVDAQFERQREYIDLLVARERAELLVTLLARFDENRKENEAKLADFRKDMDRKFTWMIAGFASVMLGLAGVIAGQVALFFR